MAEPPVKRQKMDSPKPIVFTLPGYQQDVCLTVFNQEFHVHSVLLKVHSAFFRKFLDSPNKAPKSVDSSAAPAADGTTPAEASQVSMNRSPGFFKYRWVTNVEKDDLGSWYLVAETSKSDLPELADFTGKIFTEIKTFETLLRAIYLMQYEIVDAQHLTSLTALADYYCALPIVSRTLDIALHRSSFFIDNEIPRYPCEVFKAASQLRNELIFKESLIWIVGRWSTPHFKHLQDPKLEKIAHQVWADISIKMAEAHSELLNVLSRDSYGSENLFRQDLSNLIATFDHEDIIPLPEYYRKVYDYVKSDFHFLMAGGDCLKARLEILLQNNLSLNTNKDQYKAGAGSDSDDLDHDMEYFFLCAEIEDEDLPWDITATDW